MKLARISLLEGRYFIYSENYLHGSTEKYNPTQAIRFTFQLTTGIQTQERVRNQVDKPASSQRLKLMIVHQIALPIAYDF